MNTMKKERLKKQVQKKHPLKKDPPPAKPVRRYKYAGLAGLATIILLGIIIYSNSFTSSFHFDDIQHIVNNKTIRDLSDIKAWWGFSPNRPVSIFTLVLNYRFAGLDVRYWHLVNLAIHLINACLVWWLTKIILSSNALKGSGIVTYKAEIAFFIALLFVSHPLATQPVNYIIQRMTTLVAMFYLLSVALYARARLSEKGALYKTFLFSGSLVSAVFAMLTKENAFTLPFAVLLFEFFFIRTKKLSVNFRDWRVILVTAAFLAVILIVPMNYSLSIFKPIVPTGHPESVLTPMNYFLTQFKVIVKYIQLLFLPVDQNVDYDFPISTSFFQPGTVLSFLFLAAVILLAAYLYKKQRIISFGIFWFFLTLSIESSFIPLPDVIFEHRTYLPSFGFFLVIVPALYLLLRDKYKLVAMGILAILTISNSCLAYERNKVWKDDLSMWNDIVKKSPDKARAVTSRGLAYAELGQWEKAVADYTRALQIDPKAHYTLISRGLAYKNMGRFDDAMADYTSAIAINPADAITFCNRGVSYFMLGEREKAIADFSRAIELDPGLTDAYSNRGAAFLETGQWDGAIADITKAISLSPDHYQAYSNRGAVYDKLGRLDNAMADFSKAIALNPQFAKAYVNRGAIYGKLGQWDKALADYSRAIEIEPGYIQAYFNRGVIYANLGQPDKAIAEYTRTIQLDPGFKLGYYNRGLTYGKLGMLEKAISDFTKALEIDPGFTAAHNNREVAYRKLAGRKK
jgi:protein O-mannosyl-transferase